MAKRALPLLALLLAALACTILTPATPTPLPPPSPSALPPASSTPLPPTPAPSPTATAAAAASETPAASASATSAAPGNTFVAYIDQGQLLVTDVTGGVKGGTTQYTQAGDDDQALDLAWSPSGGLVAFTSSAPAGGDPHLLYVYAIGAGTPVDLGPGSVAAWSPDSTRLAYQQAGNLWVVSIDNPQPQQLTHEDNWAWGRPAWTPDGQALIVTGTSFNNMGASGNTSFWLYNLPLDGSGTLTQLPGQSAPAEGRLPYDLRFSPDGQHLSFSTSFHLSACASIGAFYLANADGSDLHAVPMPSLDAAANPDQEVYGTVFGYGWLPDSSAVVLAGVVRNCKDFAGNIVLAELVRLSLDGQEAWTVQGEFSGPSADRTGAYVAATLSTDPSGPGLVKIYSADGQPVLDIGQGGEAELQP